MNLSVQQLPVVAELPDPFATENGQRIKSPSDWPTQRERIKALLLAYEYGHLPPPPNNLRVVGEFSESALKGRARHEHVLLSCGPRNALEFSLDLLVPCGKAGPFPVVLTGDAQTTPIPEEVVERCYILAQFDRTRFAPDTAGRTGGIYALYPDCEAGALAAWAWGYSRIIDYLESRFDVDAKRIAITGHSRGGKSVALAGALDERIALTAPNESGTGGASPFRIGGKGSESLAKITGRFGYWFHPRLQLFAGREQQLPFDQHFLLSLVAPRALYLNIALSDPYSNPDATRQSFLAAQQVFDFLDAGSKTGFRVRVGGHSFNEDDWRALLDFADHEFFGRALKANWGGAEFLDSSVPSFSWRPPCM